MWRKPKRSMGNGNCVEVTDWRKSSLSYSTGGCVKVASGVLVRDSKNTDVVITFPADAWREFTGELRDH